MSDTACFFIGLVTACFLFALLSTLPQSKTTKLINECEAELPRNQRCKLIAVPEGGQDE